MPMSLSQSVTNWTVCWLVGEFDRPNKRNDSGFPPPGMVRMPSDPFV